MSGENKIVFLGDYIDYGPQSREVLESIMHLQKKYGVNKVVVLLGNHEKDFLDWLEEYENFNGHLAKTNTYSKCEWLQQEQDCDYETLKSFLSPEHWKTFSSIEHILSWDSRNAEAVGLLLEDADQLFEEVCDYKEIHDSVAGKNYDLVLCHYPIFSWKRMGKGSILLYGHTHDSEEDTYYQKCISDMVNNDCRHVYKTEVRAINVGCMKLWINYEPKSLKEILEYDY